MGRFWNTKNFHGKFGVGCQPSDDPEFFGMEIDEFMDEFLVTYWTKDDERPKAIVKKCFDYLEVPKEERLYCVLNQENLERYYKKYYDYAFKEDKNGEFTDGEKTYSQRKDGAFLALSRLNLGLAILSDITLNRECVLEAELF